MPCAWIAIRLTARSLLSEPSRSFTRAVGRPKRPCARQLDRDQVAVAAPVGGAGRNGELAAELLLVDRHQPAAAARQRAEDAEHALPGAVEDLDDAAGVADRVAVLAGSPRCASARGRRRRGFRPGAPCAAHECGFSAPRRAPRCPIRSAPRSVRRRSRPVMSASTTEGRAPAWCSFLRRRLDLALVGQFAQHLLAASRGRRSSGRRRARSRARRPCPVRADEGEKRPRGRGGRRGAAWCGFFQDDGETRREPARGCQPLVTRRPQRAVLAA